MSQAMQGPRRTGIRYVVLAPAFPADSRLTVMWFPARERAFATAIVPSALV